MDQSIRKSLLSARQFQRTITQLGQYLLVGGIIRGVKNFVEEQINAADALKHNAEALGLSADELQKYQYVAGQMQVPVQQVAVAMRFFNRAVGEASFGTKSATKVFSQLGLNIRDAHGDIRPTDELLFEFADKLKNIPSSAQRTALAMRTLGRGGAALLPILQQGSAALKEMFKDVDELGGGFTDEFIEQAHETEYQLARLKLGWRSVFVAIAMEVLPVFRRWLDNGIKNVKHLIDLAQHTYFFRTALVALASGTLFFALYRLFSLFSVGSIGLKDIFTFFVKYPIIAAFAAAIVAVYLAVDDLYTFLQGGDSILGRFLDQIGGKGTAMQFWEDLKNAIKKVEDALTPVGDSLKGVGKELLKTFVDSIPDIIKFGGQFTMWVVKNLDRAITFTRELTTAVAGLFSSNDDQKKQLQKDALEIEEGYDKRAALYDKASNVFASIGTQSRSPDDVPDLHGNGVGTRVPSADELNPGRTTGSLQVTNNITVHGAGSPRETANAVKTAAKEGTASAIKRNTYDRVSDVQPMY